MNALVVYTSRYKNTEHIAQKITTTLGESLNVGIIPVEGVTRQDLAKVDILVLGSPTHLRGWSPKLKKLLTSLRIDCPSRVQVAVFDTRRAGPTWLTGSAALGLANQLKVRGINLLGKPGSFTLAGANGPLAQGELERAGQWASDILAAASQSGRPLTSLVPSPQAAD